LLDGNEGADAGAELLGGVGGGAEDDDGENGDEREASAARGFGSRSVGKERADGESHDQAADVRGIADARDGSAEN